MKHLGASAALASLLLFSGVAIARQQGGTAPDAAPPLLVSATGMEALTAAAQVPLDSGLTLTLEPGVRLTRVDGGYLLAAHDGKNLELEAGTRRLALVSPARAERRAGGWSFNGGTPLNAAAFTARRASQDDADANLKSMQEAARKLQQAKPPAPQDPAEPAHKLRVRWLYGEDPMPTAELFNTPALQQLTHLSPIGF